MAKKYEITIEGLTIDFYMALSGNDAQDYNEHFSNRFLNLVHIATLPDGETRDEIRQKTLDEIYCRAYNYMRYGKGFNAHTACLFAEALRCKVLSYRLPVLPEPR